MSDRPILTQQELECWEMFQIYETGAHELAALKTHVKQWEYVLYGSGGRPEFYPQDRHAILTLLQFKNERIEKEQKSLQKKQEIEERMKRMRARSGGK